MAEPSARPGSRSALATSHASADLSSDGLARSWAAGLSVRDALLRECLSRLTLCEMDTASPIERMELAEREAANNVSHIAAQLVAIHAREHWLADGLGVREHTRDAANREASGVQNERDPGAPTDVVLGLGDEALTDACRCATFQHLTALAGPHAVVFPDSLHTRDETSALGGAQLSQGALGDGFLLCALAALLGSRRDLLLRIVCASNLRFGIFGVRLCLDGAWTAILLDDRVPVLETRAGAALAFASCGAFACWLPLIEKAYAKAMGGAYVRLHGGRMADALEVLTGGVAWRESLAAEAAAPAALAQPLASRPLGLGVVFVWRGTTTDGTDAHAIEMCLGLAGGAVYGGGTDHEGEFAVSGCYACGGAVTLHVRHLAGASLLAVQTYSGAYDFGVDALAGSAESPLYPGYVTTFTMRVAPAGNEVAAFARVRAAFADGWTALQAALAEGQLLAGAFGIDAAGPQEPRAAALGCVPGMSYPVHSLRLVGGRRRVALIEPVCGARMQPPPATGASTDTALAAGESRVHSAAPSRHHSAAGGGRASKAPGGAVSPAAEARRQSQTPVRSRASAAHATAGSARGQRGRRRSPSPPRRSGNVMSRAQQTPVAGAAASAQALATLAEAAWPPRDCFVLDYEREFCSVFTHVERCELPRPNAHYVTVRSAWQPALCGGPDDWPRNPQFRLVFPSRGAVEGMRVSLSLAQPLARLRVAADSYPVRCGIRVLRTRMRPVHIVRAARDVIVVADVLAAPHERVAAVQLWLDRPAEGLAYFIIPYTSAAGLMLPFVLRAASDAPLALDDLVRPRLCAACAKPIALGFHARLDDGGETDLCDTCLFRAAASTAERFASYWRIYHVPLHCSLCRIELSDAYRCLECDVLLCARCRVYFQQAATMLQYAPFHGHKFEHDSIRVHIAWQCAGCGMLAFRGARYTCLACAEIVLCELCVEAGWEGLGHSTEHELDEVEDEEGPRWRIDLPVISRRRVSRAHVPVDLGTVHFRGSWQLDEFYCEYDRPAASAKQPPPPPGPPPPPAATAEPCDAELGLSTLNMGNFVGLDGWIDSGKLWWHLLRAAQLEAVRAAAVQTALLAAGWLVLVDPRTGSRYYVDAMEESTWHEAEALAAAGVTPPPPAVALECMQRCGLGLAAPRRVEAKDAAKRAEEARARAASAEAAAAVAAAAREALPARPRDRLPVEVLKTPSALRAVTAPERLRKRLADAGVRAALAAAWPAGVAALPYASLRSMVQRAAGCELSEDEAVALYAACDPASTGLVDRLAIDRALESPPPMASL